MIMHIPIYAYRQAFEDAFRKEASADGVTLEMFLNGGLSEKVNFACKLKFRTED